MFTDRHHINPVNQPAVRHGREVGQIGQRERLEQVEQWVSFEATRQTAMRDPHGPNKQGRTQLRCPSDPLCLTSPPRRCTQAGINDVTERLLRVVRIARSYGRVPALLYPRLQAYIVVIFRPHPRHAAVG